VIGSKTRHIDEESKCPDMVVFSDQFHVELLGAFVYRGVDKARPRFARTDCNILASSEKVPFHFIVGRCWVGEMVHKGSLERAEVVRIKTDR